MSLRILSLFVFMDLHILSLRILSLFVFMDLHILSWNVNGMHFTSASGPRKLCLRRELRSHVDRSMDVLLV